MAERQVAAEFGDGGMVIGQLLPDGQGRAVLGLRRRRLAQHVPSMRLWLADIRPRKSETAGFSSASFCWMARAVRYSASAAADLTRLREHRADAKNRVRQVVPGLLQRSRPPGQRLC